MPIISKIKSLRSLFISILISFFTLTFLASLTAIIYKVHQQEKALIEQNTMLWASHLAKKSTPYLKRNSDTAHNELKQKLTEWVFTSLINRIHIYRIKANGKPDFLTSYNKNIYFPPIQDKVDEIANLHTFRYQKNYLELVIEIIDKQEVVGYLYIQSNLSKSNYFLKELTYTAIGLIVFAVLCALLIALWLHSKTVRPINKMVETVQQISQSKNYATRLSHPTKKELDVLAQNINIMLTRTEKNIVRLEDIYQHALKENEELKEKVNFRTNALKESNQDLLSTLEKLHQFQEQLVETKKIASLGDMVAGIAHEVNTPIGLGVTASSLLADKLDEIKSSFEEKTLKSSQLKKFLTDGEENVAIIFRNLERAAKLISSFKKVAVDQTSAECVTFNVRVLLEEVILTLAAKLKSSQVSYTLDCPDDLMIKSKPGPLNQIIINLILNSIYHAFEGLEQRSFNISIIILSEQLHISYSDNGNGINENIKKRIFEPFTTTKRGAGGSGLGLHLVYNLVTQVFDGYINVESSQGNGVKFDITFPVVIIPKIKNNTTNVAT